MRPTRDELARRLEEADRRIRMLRRCTLDLSEMRRKILEGLQRGPDRPRPDSPARG